MKRVAAIAVLVLVGAVTFWWLRDDGPVKVTVPDVEGADVLAAQRRLTDAGLELRLDKDGSTVPDTPIVSQRPAAGQEAERGTAVAVSLRDDASRRVAAWDDFEDPERSWFEENSAEEGETRLQDGGLVVRLKQPRVSWWEIDDFDPAHRGGGEAFRAHSDLPATGARIAVHVHRLSGSAAGAYGLVCAGQNADPSYQFLIDRAGRYAVLRNDRDEPLQDWELSFEIDGTRDVLEVACRPLRGGVVELSFWANSVRLARIRDPNGIPPHHFGIHTEFDRGLAVRFDDFIFQPLEPGTADREWWALQPVNG